MALSPFLSRSSSAAYDPFEPRDPISLPPWLNDDTFSPFQLLFFDASSALAAPQVDWTETPDAHIFQANLPGLKKEDIKLEVEKQRVMTINAGRNSGTERWQAAESFLGQVRIPNDAKLEGMTTRMEDGVLVIKLPKEQQPKSRVKALTLS